MRKVYLGDGVYAEVREGVLVLTAENGISVTDEIHLEVEVWEMLKAYIESIA
jgi:hypothetical protein